MKLRCLALSVGAAAAMTGSLASAGEAELEARIQQLENQLQQLMAAQQAQQEQVRVHEERLDQVIVADGAGMKNPVSGTTLSYGGFVRSDVLMSDYSGGDKATAGVGDDFLVASTIPIGGDDGDIKTDIHSKFTRFWLKTATPTDVGLLKTHIEMDFAVGGQGDERISNSYANRLRHAYIEWEREDGSKWLFGQAWSTFFNVAALPGSVDFVGPVGTAFERQPQIRYTNGNLMLAIENPSSGLYGSGDFSGSNNYDDNTTPDLVARYNGKAGDLSWSIAGIGREISYREGNEDDSSYAGAVSLSGVWSLGADSFKFMLNYGTLGRYMGLQSYRDGVIEADGDIDTIDQVGGFISYSHRWNQHWNSVLTLSMSEADNPNVLDDTTTPSSYSSVHANLTYQPTPKLMLGGELIYAEKEIEGEINGEDSGELTRFQFMTRYLF